jgi:type IV pilus assembly protein PilV
MLNTRIFPTVRGFSLLEVLIALVVLSVGLLGLAALQAEGLRGSSTAHNRFQAIRLASDIAARIRANEDAIDISSSEGPYAYEIANTVSAASGASHGCADIGSDTEANTCSAANMAAFDLFEWRRDLAESLPDGTGAIDITVGNSIITADVSVEWTERTNRNGAPGQVRTEFQF